MRDPGAVPLYKLLGIHPYGAGILVEHERLQSRAGITDHKVSSTIIDKALNSPRQFSHAHAWTNWKTGSFVTMTCMENRSRTIFLVTRDSGLASKCVQELTSEREELESDCSIMEKRVLHFSAPLSPVELGCHALYALVVGVGVTEVWYTGSLG